MKEFYDVAVVGAGPAGAVFAREIKRSRPELSVAVINGQTRESAKACGGLLAPDAQKLLARFDMTLPKSVLSDPQIFAVETIDLVTKSVRYYQRHYLNMDRFAFDSWLLSLAEGAEIINGRCTDIEREEDGYLITVGDRVIRAGVLVGADGANSIVRRRFFKPMRVRYTAIQEWFEYKGQKTPYYSCIFDKETSDSCSWTIHKDGYVIFGGAFATHGSREAYEKQKARLEEFLGVSFGEPIRTEACLVSSPRSMRDFVTGKGSAFLIGESAGFISASSFEGISSAIMSAKLLADAFGEEKEIEDIQKRYKKETKKLRLKLYVKTHKRAVLCSPFLRKIIMKSGITAIEPYKKP